MQKLPMERMRPIRDEVYHRIRQAILRGAYHPGERIQEEALAEELGTSRTPVREALRKLEVERLVTYYPHKGTVVAEVPTHEVEDLFGVLSTLECMLVRRIAAETGQEALDRLRYTMAWNSGDTALDPGLEERFFQVLHQVSDAENLAYLAGRVWELLQRAGALRPVAPEELEQLREKLSGLVDALEAGDANQAEAWMLAILGRNQETAVK